MTLVGLHIYSVQVQKKQQHERLRTCSPTRRLEKWFQTFFRQSVTVVNNGAHTTDKSK